MNNLSKIDCITQQDEDLLHWMDAMVKAHLTEGAEERLFEILNKLLREVRRLENALKDKPRKKKKA